MSHTSRRIAEAVSAHVVEISQTHLANIVASYETLQHANDELRKLTGISRFFESRSALDEFQRLTKLPAQNATSQKKGEWGDFQTPTNLARQVCQYLLETGVSPSVVVEPTYGGGNFILAALETFPAVDRVYGVEIQEQYEWQLKMGLLIRALLGRRPPAEIELRQDSIFTHSFPETVLTAQNLLIIGNPPWVTNAELGTLESGNLPQKRNIKSLNGMDALTGKSNFDIGEYILLRLLDLFSQSRGTLAMLCKNSTAKNIVEILPRKQFAVSNIRKLEINAGREFGVAVEACLFVMDFGADMPELTCQVATLDTPEQVLRSFGWVNKRFASNIKDYESVLELDGKSSLVWRQGLKHDCAPIMELEVNGASLINGNSEAVDVEEDHLYWVLKSSGLRRFATGAPKKKVIVTQKRVGEDTSTLQVNAPKLWRYLAKNSHYFEKRKSRIYQNKPRFSIFGIGDYSFENYKVAISGMYKEPVFALVCPFDNRPIMLDDTCYFLGFDNYLDALLTASLLNSPPIKQFFRSIVFTDAKRPYTKEALMRLNFTRAVEHLSLNSLYDFWDSVGYEPRLPVIESDLERYKRNFSITDKQQMPLQLELGVQV